MFYVKKHLEVSASHQVKMPGGKCEAPHGHNWFITVYCKSEKLDEHGMVVDFCQIKSEIMSRLDHKNLNEVLNFNPTAENIAHWIAHLIPYCYRVDVQESRNNEAIYEKSECEKFEKSEGR